MANPFMTATPSAAPSAAPAAPTSVGHNPFMDTPVPQEQSQTETPKPAAAAAPTPPPTPSPEQAAPTDQGNPFKNFVHDIGSTLMAPAEYPKKSFDLSQSFDAATKTISSVFSDLGNKIQSYAEHGSILDTSTTPTQKLASGGQVLTSAISPLFLPVSAGLNAVSTLPVIGGFADALKAVFGALGKGGSDLAIGTLDAAPIPQQTKDDLRDLVGQVGGLVAQLVVGEAVMPGGAEEAPVSSEEAPVSADEVPKPPTTPIHKIAAGAQAILQKASESLQKPEVKEELARMQSSPDFKFPVADKPVDMPQGSGPTRLLPPPKGSVNMGEIAGDISKRITDARDFVAKRQTISRMTTNLGENLKKIEGENAADQIDAKEFIQSLPNISKGDKASIAHYAEDKNFPATEPQKAYFNAYVKPLSEENAKLITKIRQADIPISADDHITRYVMGKGNVFERIQQSIGKMGSPGARSLAKGVGALKRRIYKAAEDENGNRTVIAMKGGKITSFEKGEPKALGSYKRVSDTVFKGRDGKTYKIKDATMREIEANTKTRYFKDPALTEMHTYMRLKQAGRAIDFMNAWKDSPQVKYNPETGEGVMMKMGEGTAPQGWTDTQMPQFRGYVMDPKVAETLDDFYGQLKSGEDPLMVLGAVNGFIRDLVVFNPIAHWFNLSTFAFESAGASSLVRPAAWARGMKYGWKAIQNTASLNEEYKTFLREGAPVLYGRMKGNSLSKMMFDKMTDEMAHDSILGEQVAKAMWYANPGHLISSLRRFSRDATWSFNDVLEQMLVYSEMDKHGISMEEAIRNVNRIYPDNNLPPRVLGSRGLKKVMANQNVTVFSHYHYSAVKGFMTPFMDLVKPSLSMAERGKALDRIAAIALMSTVIFPIMDSLAQQATGNPNAQMRRAGVTALPNNLIKLGKTHRIDTFLQTLIMPSPILKSGAELVLNHNLYNFNKIYSPETWKGDLLNYAAQTMSGSQIKTTPTETLLNTIGVTEPVNTTTASSLTDAIYNDRPLEDAKVKQLYLSGKADQANQMMEQFNQRLVDTAIEVYKEQGKVNDSNEAQMRQYLWTKGLRQYFLYPPSAKALIQAYAHQGQPTINKVVK